MLTCPAAELVDGSKVLYFEQVSIIIVQFYVYSLWVMIV